ncbi:hypothetical protein [Methylomonas koyamae]|uniref:Uncharacterized protein n=1 Tax=Methylomonas koyamae TaxID=702114 RepID=A0A291IP82_9GAMM|nr:hypothetical protein [Methylomonas koyamae]ATG92034.1 hypothetical protein MKLM6_3855 [Methylomonas koyamae]OAI25438.1 hypothetical protein A1356_13295 [Methylomonas koyamae]
MARWIMMVMLLAWHGWQPASAWELEDAPEALKPWLGWVLHDQPQHGCPFYFNDFQNKQCAWPGALVLNLQDNRGNFESEWTLYRKGWIELPGDERHWPQAVTVDKQAYPVALKNGKPALELAAGHYRIGGQFSWERLPEQLALPQASGLVRLMIDGRPVTYPRIEQNAVWLADRTAANAGDRENRLELQVFRQIIDESPLQIVTRLELEVSGTAREAELAHALLPGFIPVNLDSPLPARLDGAGRLLVQVRPGHWLIEVHGRHPQYLTQLDLAIKDADWPQEELWTFQAVPNLRLVEIGKPVAIDGSQTNLPDEWRQLPAYRLQQGDSMVFNVIRRGDPEPEPNQLALTRTLWLDFAGTGYTVNDRISGSMRRDWRLNAAPELQLGQVQLNGQSQLITQAADHSQGVEIRSGNLQLNADSRIETGISALSASGWQQRFQQVRAELKTPPGWRLLAVAGVDNAADTWLNRWTLLDLFLVLIGGLAAGRLWSPQWGGIALLGLSLIWHEHDAPRLIWLLTLATLALLRVLPEGRARHWLAAGRNLCWLALVALAIPFVIEQIRIGIYPQLELPEQIEPSTAYSSAPAAPEALMSDAADAELSAAAVLPEARAFKRSYAAKSESGAGSAANLERADPDANLQTGPGLPRWQWRSVHLAWNGGVDSQQQVRLWYLPPWAMMLLHFLQAAITIALVLRLTGISAAGWRRVAPHAACLLLAPLLVTPGRPAYADLPDPQLLAELKARLLQAPTCLPDCAQIVDMQVIAKPELLRLELQVHAQQAVALPVPAQGEQWLPETVEIDGAPGQALFRSEAGEVWLALPRGVHSVALQGRYREPVKFTLPLPLIPQRASFAADGWRIDGGYEDGKVGPQLEFSRLQTETPAGKAPPQTALPAFVRVSRTLHLGLDWRITTQVESLAESGNPIMFELPLLQGEAVTTPQVRVKDGKVLVNIAASEGSAQWESVLAKSGQIDLLADSGGQWYEVWRAEVSPIWRLHSQGLDPIYRENPQGPWLPEWRPWPGERLSLKLERPAAVAGATLTIDASELLVQPGARNQTAELKLDIRSSKGGRHTVTLPDGAQLQEVAIDGISQPIRQQGAGVSLPLRPGNQQAVLKWHMPQPLGFVTATPSANLGSASVNSRIRLIMPQNRWLLWTAGPDFGPAALIWGLLLVLALIAFGLGKTGTTPLKHWEWFLLLSGLSQLHVAAGIFVAGWLFALHWRAKQPAAGVRRFNLLQIGLAASTLLALLILALAVEQGLLGSPEMQIAGNQSTAYQLNWYQDRNGPQLPSATVASLPLAAYRGLMLAWALWLAAALLNWLRWGWACFAAGGIWRKSAKT